MDAKTRRVVKQIVTEAVREALTVEWVVERRRDPATGMPLAVPLTERETVFLPSAIMQALPYHEAALRGLQADIAKHQMSVEELRRLSTVIEAAAPVLERLALAMNKPNAEITSGDYRKIRP
jgi:hypothetical protein